MSCPPDKSCVQLKLITVVEVKNDLGVKINRLQEVKTTLELFRILWI